MQRAQTDWIGSFYPTVRMFNHKPAAQRLINTAVDGLIKSNIKPEDLEVRILANDDIVTGMRMIFGSYRTPELLVSFARHISLKLIIA
ncbi:MAG: hypothetical protein ACRDDY_05355 [Clostridium sp.]|uniref:hypothetical protein n=1 Tax=Clostridium sp. TaxID=1506 RepID=UPI003EE4DD50